jgi:UDP-N-acetylglucosamine diphosphorylase / glucose-1-phosphate thymidylyltransferase / UDP-N-acetylgalactosamine diphosphorylase / glucosamine-1-phosphate N-acetyltransferase / galactosamine-1-phosphate N-acetyltransferase
MNTTIKKAVLLAAGKGTRMKELTNDLPKPMLEVQGKPILHHIVDGLKAAGVTHFCIIVGYKAEVVRAYFGDGSHFGIHVTYATQVVQDGTGRVVELAKDFAGSDAFVLSYGDILISPDNYPQIVELGDSAAIVTVKHNEGEIAKGGCVVVDEKFHLTDLIEKPAGKAPSPWYNAGVYAFRPGIFEYTAKLKLSPRGEYELTDAIRDLAQSGNPVRVLELKGDWADVRDPEVLAALNG